MFGEIMSRSAFPDGGGHELLESGSFSSGGKFSFAAAEIVSDLFLQSHNLHSGFLHFLSKHPQSRWSGRVSGWRSPEFLEL